MAWMKWSLWAGNVINRRIRIPPRADTYLTAYGQSEWPIGIRSAALGTVLEILPEDASRPDYVLFKGTVSYSLAARVLFKKADNSEVMWKDFHKTRMPRDRAEVVICYPLLNELEIEYEPVR